MVTTQDTLGCVVNKLQHIGYLATDGFISGQIKLHLHVAFNKELGYFVLASQLSVLPLGRSRDIAKLLFGRIVVQHIQQSFPAYLRPQRMQKNRGPPSMFGNGLTVADVWSGVIPHRLAAAEAALNKLTH